MNYPINSNNVIGWLKLLLAVGGVDDSKREAVLKYISRTDKKRRQKELDNIFGGESW